MSSVDSVLLGAETADVLPGTQWYQWTALGTEVWAHENIKYICAHIGATKKKTPVGRVERNQITER